MKNKFDILLMEEAKNFVLSLHPKAQKKVAFVLQKSRQVNDPEIFKKISANIWEFRIRWMKQSIRLFAFWDVKKNSFIICTHGIIKKTQKTPIKEIDKAEEIRKRYLKSKS